MIHYNTSPSFMDSFGKHLYMGLLQFAILMHIKQFQSNTWVGIWSKTELVKNKQLHKRLFEKKFIVWEPWLNSPWFGTGSFDLFESH
jgi:hypothetical protein